MPDNIDVVKITDELEANMRTLVVTLAEKLGRMPEEEEVITFIFGSNEDRASMLENATKEVSEDESGTPGDVD